MVLRNYSEITPKLLRNWGTVEFRNYSEIEDRGTPKLWNSETMGLGPWPWNYGITPKLWTGTMVFRNYSEIGDRGTTELLRNYSETMGLGPWNSENCGLL